MSNGISTPAPPDQPFADDAGAASAHLPVGARDPRWLNVFPSSEMANWKRQWPVVPTFVYGGINSGVVERPPSRNGA